jgi:FHA domain
MISCSNCKSQEYIGALFCSQCGANLVEAKKTAESVFQPINTDFFSEMFSGEFPTSLDMSDQSGTALWLSILDFGELVAVPERKEFTLGRASSDQPIIPDVDLTPFNAYKAGVSRLHATIRLNGEKMTIVDLGSANGTQLNGEKIEPNVPYDLMHGDVVKLGRLKIQILARE